MPAPAPGTVVDGYRFKGGDPNSRASWEPAGGSVAPSGQAPAADLSAWGPGATALPNGNVVHFTPRGRMVVLGQLPPQGAAVDQSAPGFQYLPPRPARPDQSENAYYAKWRMEDNARVSSARTGASRARTAEGLLNRQQQQGQGTGGIYGIPVVGDLAGWMDPEIRQLDAIQAEVARTRRQPGEGAISDFDAQQFVSMTYGKDKPIETNRSLIRAQRLADDSVIQRRQYMEWFRNNYGTLSGAEEGWDRYAQDNPIFDPSSESAGKPRLNLKRTNWRAYFGAGGDTRATQSQQDVARAEGVRPDRGVERQAQTYQAMRDAGGIDRTKPLGSREHPYVATSREQLSQLATNRARWGQWAIGPSGALVQIGRRDPNSTSAGGRIVSVERVGAR